MRTLVRRLVPGLVLPLLLIGLSPSEAAEPATPTVAISNFAGPGLVGAVTWAGALCSKIPHGILAVACTAYVSVYAYLLDRSFTGAAGSGRSVEMHFSRIGAPLWWKTESC